ncbi:hypothetical protein BGZ76_008944, partial [Entomortierella beljakovae]
MDNDDFLGLFLREEGLLEPDDEADDEGIEGEAEQDIGVFQDDIEENEEDNNNIQANQNNNNNNQNNQNNPDDFI